VAGCGKPAGHRGAHRNARKVSKNNNLRIPLQQAGVCVNSLSNPAVDRPSQRPPALKPVAKPKNSGGDFSAKMAAAKARKKREQRERRGDGSGGDDDNNGDGRGSEGEGGEGRERRARKIGGAGGGSQKVLTQGFLLCKMNSSSNPCC